VRSRAIRLTSLPARWAPLTPFASPMSIPSW
jgi:hypothetical protein